MGGLFQNHQHPPFFSKMRTIFKNRLAWFQFYRNLPWSHTSRFLKNILIFGGKKGGCWCFPRVCMVGCMDRISQVPYKFKIRTSMVIFRIAASKNHIELDLLLVQVRSETGFVILSKFWSRYYLQCTSIRLPEFSKPKVFGWRPGMRPTWCDQELNFSIFDFCTKFHLTTSYKNLRKERRFFSRLAIRPLRTISHA